MDEQNRPVLETVQQMLDQVRANAVFGSPIQAGQETLIPVAEVSYGFGYGSGRGPADEEGKPVSGGGGAGGRAVPRGYIRIGPGGVAFEPILDINRLGMAGILMVAWSVFWIAKAIRATAGER